MSQIEWYYARGNKQSGPVSSIELKRLADAGEISPDDLVWREGMTEWSAARNVRGLFEEEGRGGAATLTGLPGTKAADATISNAAPPAGQSALSFGPRDPSRHFFDSMLDWLRVRFNAQFIEATAKHFRTFGFYGLFAAMGLIAACELIVAVKTNTPSGLLWAAALLLTLAVLQYTAGKFCDALEHLNRTTSGSLSSTAFPDSFALLSLASGVGALLTSVAIAIQSAMYLSLLWGIAGFIVCGYLAFVALNLGTLNVSVAPQARAGEEAIGVLTFLVKAVLQLVHVAFGAGVALSLVMLGYVCSQAFSGTEGLLIVKFTEPVALMGVIYSAALPLIAYLTFLFYSLLLDLCRAVLVTPSKLDKLAEKGVEKKSEEKKSEQP
jgi:hypothetical protein